MWRVLLGFFLVIFVGAGTAQTKIPVYVDGTVGQTEGNGDMLLYELKEAIRGSHGYRLVQEAKDWPYLKIDIVVTTSAVGGRKIGIAYSYVIVYDSSGVALNGLYITSGVQVCPYSALASCARSNLPEIEKAAEHLKKNANHLWKTLQ